VDDGCSVLDGMCDVLHAMVAYNEEVSQAFRFGCRPGVELKDTCPRERGRRSSACRARSGVSCPTSAIRRNL
jgi:hypothetical protein